ncbi:hypothetical protein FisN_24Lh132 [Fistulifera solaris]|uniref:Uncharacterized protein n=1 Tax=Fistulifera solaris TaxID=1519565 RepID=A0A1Z5KA84_FISSO|nr:hypothetical protein FisN_24Lh132 [Fistulifera solaris]|eukprot:GAX22848.1 hypothetical protein FisN_24Lh132 [Fistulifera solaris]
MVEPDHGGVFDGPRSEEELRVIGNIPTWGDDDDSVIKPARMIHEPSFVDKPDTEDLLELPTEGLEAGRDAQDNSSEKSLAGGTRENGGSFVETSYLPDTEIEILQELYQRKCKECEGLKKTIAFLRQAVRETDDLLYQKSCEIEQMEFRIQSVTYLHEEKKEDIKNYKEKSKKKKNKKKEARRPMRSKMPPTPEGERKRNNNTNDPKLKRKTTRSREEPNEEQKQRKNDKENDVRNQRIKPKPEVRKSKEDFEKSERTKRKEALLASLFARQTTNECEVSTGPIEQEPQGCERREDAVIGVPVGDAKKDTTIENRSNGMFEVTSTSEQLLVEISTGEPEEQIMTVTHDKHADEIVSTSEEATIKVPMENSDVMRSEDETRLDMRSEESESKVVDSSMTSCAILALPDKDEETTGAHTSSAGEHSATSQANAAGDDSPILVIFEKAKEQRSGHSDRLDNFRRRDIAQQNYHEETSLDIAYPTLLDGNSSSTTDGISETSSACISQCAASDDVDSADHVANSYTLSAEEPGALAPQPSDLADESNLPHFTDENTLLFSHETQNLVIDLDELYCEAMGSSSQGNSSQSNEDVSHSVEPASSSPSANLSESDAPLSSTTHDSIKLPQANEPVVVRVEI